MYLSTALSLHTAGVLVYQGCTRVSNVKFGVTSVQMQCWVYAMSAGQVGSDRVKNSLHHYFMHLSRKIQ